MGELEALTSNITGIVKKCVSEVIAEDAPKLMGKDTKRYYWLVKRLESESPLFTTGLTRISLLLSRKVSRPLSMLTIWMKRSGPDR